MIEKFIKSNGNFALLQKAIEGGEKCSVFGLNIGEKLALVEDSAFLFYVVDSTSGMALVLDKLEALGRSVMTLSSNLTPFSSQFESASKVLDVLFAIKDKRIDTLIITPEILAGVFPNPKALDEFDINLKDTINIQNISKKLVAYGYKRVELVENEGEFSLRGDVLDIYPLGGESPIRIMTDFDEVQSIRHYNPFTLLSTKELNTCNIKSLNYFNVITSDIDDFYTNHKIKKDNLYFELTSSTNTDYRKLVFDKNFSSSIFDYVDDGVIAFDGAKAIYDNLSRFVNDYNENVANAEFKKILVDEKKDLSKILKFDGKFSLLAFHFIQQNNRIFSPTKVFSIRSIPAVNYCGHLNVLGLDVANFLKQDYTIIICAGSDEQANKIESILQKDMIQCHIFPRISMCLKGVNIVTRKYPLDIVLPEEKLAIISTPSLFGKPKKIIQTDTSFVDGEIPNENDYVVHNLHGIGRCLGVKTLKISSGLRDYIVIEYKGDDKVYLPVENLNQISKYVGSDKEPKLNKIGGAEFEKTKTKVKTAVKKIAFDLIALYKERLNIKGFKYPKDDEMQRDFESSFGFSETADQIKCINDCKADMESGKAMDRLICGDVGFGKTEVALRVAFKTILSGKQVAFLCPTTILSEQHFNTASARMSNFPIKVDVLNRLRSKSDENRIKQEFSAGKIDLLCGTHKLLSKDIDYKNLGLLVLDEEQKFGVSDKEKIKNIKKHVNVLTLSATPIPRTLNMSLIGVRDISVIETPPTERIETEVQVVAYSETLIKNAIERELGRHGQVLVIYNRVEKIFNYASVIKNLVPNAVVSVAHGQMDEDQLEKEIFNLYSGKTQVLVATTLIENGVDLPNANTLIVINSDMLGLSQLYQLKGRIGRSDKSSYAYFTFDNRKELNENAYKRLSAIKEFSGMGSGFKIAMRDLEIRGAGSLLGAEQSGHIEKIGYNMYVQLLSDSVKELKGEKVTARFDIRVETSLSAYLSHDYVPSSAVRMSMYREISNFDTLDAIKSFEDKLIENYGDVPEELDNLCKIALIKNRLSVFGVERVSIKPKSSIVFGGKENLNAKIIDAVNKCEGASLNLSDLPVIEINCKEKDKILDSLIGFISEFDNF